MATTSDGHERESPRAPSPVESAPERDQAQAGRNPARRQPDQRPGQGRSAVPEHGRDDQRRRDELTAIDQGHPRVRQQQITRRHRHAR